jgi:iron complex transport system ATP-binding protein
LKDVDFDLRPGRIAAILGPNGAGKTTLLSLTLGWLSAWTGEIHLSGNPLRALPPRERGRLMALVPQAEHTPFDYTVLEYVLMGRAPHLPPLEMPSATDTEIAMNSLEQVGIESLAHRPVPQLSGGERQLMLLARALAQLAQPPNSQSPITNLLLLDEPTAHLDLHNKFRIIEIMRRLRDSGVTLLMTNHEPDVVLAVADDVLLMESGVSPQFGTLDEVFTAEALSRVYGLPIRLVQVNGHKQVLWT